MCLCTYVLTVGAIGDPRGAVTPIHALPASMVHDGLATLTS